ncbi:MULTISPECIES: type I restriction-modification system subunit M [Mycobacterium]|uniref:site-specific DNA-methyltransferase (adenine-specific) n=1 Tax=Mycobacterium gordonae TaxID=1778 RepID=A0A1A6BKP1_MYCGO|nr:MULTISPECIES: class I SAM-dependent DNA methyltransferase [Mycobacterium]MBI2699333.1 SAM-dependent DNA methyltransferase [Mycobacterium sp.]MCQ4363940.1 type I restriction-modification system subunit M [Mycobacterium gordonae]MCV7005593.1 SAM-dependent DNA methyltransferase [Mycobacterium gordonae]OBS02789.1 restriction endonuclease subunit M [Mycobacterium gordonae]ODR21558.1 restriction endonuclease subunit M [Mycobacterium gordonae]
MPPRRKQEPQAPSTMKELKDTLWKAADKLRGSLSANQYKDVILGLVFLKYVSDSFDERREAIRAELAAEGMDDAQIEELIDDPEEYHGYNVFVVPPTARWKFLAENAKGKPAIDGDHGKNIGQLIDEAMDAVMKANPTLGGTLPRLYNRDNIDQRRLGELIDLFNSARFSRQGEHKARDLMGEVYEYFLGNFARAEGKRGGEFFTPPSVVKVIVEVLEPTQGRVYDPCCGSGGMFVQTEKFIADHNGDPKNIVIYGQESIEETWRMAKMNLAIHGIDHTGLSSRWGDTFARDQHADVQMDYVMANPPFNIKDWARNEEDPRWRFGVPPANNANYAWIQHILFKLKPGGKAGVVMANGSMSSNSNGEGDIRAQIVEADLVSCMIALPTQLFRSTGIPVCLWFFAKDKTAGKQGSVDRSGQVLFIDARELGYMVDRAERALIDDDVVRIGDTYHAWRGSSSAAAKGLVYEDIPGFCKSATLAEIKAADYALTPGRYVGAAAVEDDGEPIDEKIARLKAELLAAFDESARLEAVVREQLERIGG